MSLHRLLFDPANQAESANVGAHILAGDDGTQIGHVSDALKVSLTNASIAVTATDLDIRDLAFATDSVDVSGSSVSISGTVAVTQSTSPWVVSATDLDIRDLAFATDSVDVSNSTNVAIVDGGGSITVDAVNLDIRDLTAVSDSVQAWAHDGAGTAITSTGGALDVNVTNTIDLDDDLANTALANESTVIGTTSVAAVTSVLAARKHVKLYNNGNKPIYIGAGTVTAANGFPLFVGGILEARIGAAVAINAISTAAGQDLRILQMS